MGFRERLEVCLGFIQFLALILSIPDVPFPTVSFMWLVDFLGYLDIFAWIPWPTDFKVQFVIIVVAIPQIVNFLILIGLNRKRVVVWYFATLFFIAAFFAGAILRLIGLARGTTNEAYIQNANTLLLIGGLGLVLAVGAALADYHWSDSTVRNRIQKVEKEVQKAEEGVQKAEEDVQGNQEMSIKQNQEAVVEQVEAEQKENLSHEERMERDSRDCKVMDSLLRAGIVVACLFLGLLFIGLTTGSLKKKILKGSGIESLAMSLGVMFLVIAFFALIWLFMGLSRKGRHGQLVIGYFMEVNLMRICLIFLSLVYIPIIVRIVMVFNCNDFDCPAGSRLMPTTSEVIYNASSSQTINPPANQCEWCEASATCSGGRMATEYCMASSNAQLEYARNLTCEEMYGYFFPAALLMLLSFALGLPVSFMKLTSISANMLGRDFPVLYLGDPENLGDADIWALKVNQSRNITRFLYQSFEFKWKQWRLMMLLHKLTIVCTTVFIIRTKNDEADNMAAKVPITFAMIIHFIAFLLIFKLQPFIHRAEDRVYLIMQVCLTLTAIAGFLHIFGIYTIPLWVAITLLVLNIIVPLVAIIVTLWYTSRDVNVETAKIKGGDHLEESHFEKSQLRDDKFALSQSTQGMESSIDGPTATRPVAVSPLPGAPGAASPKSPGQVMSPKFMSPMSPMHMQQGQPVGPVGTHTTRPPPGVQKGVPLVNPFYGPGNQQHVQHQTAQYSSQAHGAAYPPLQGGNEVKNGNQPNGQDRTEEGWKGVDSYQPTYLTAPTYTSGTAAGGGGSGPDALRHGGTDPSSHPLNSTAGGKTHSFLTRDLNGTSLLNRHRTMNATMVASGTEQGENAAQPSHQSHQLGFVGASAISRFNRTEQPMVIITEEEIAEIEQLSGDEEKIKAIEERYKKAQAEVDTQIDEASLYLVRKYFMVCGALGFVALALCILGIVETGMSDTKVSTSMHASPASRSAFTEYVNNNDWPNFQVDCCCMPFYNQWKDSSNLAIEKWTCKNGWTKERVRSVKLETGAHANCSTSSTANAKDVAFRADCATTGFAVREMCQVSFLDNCTIAASGVNVEQCLSASTEAQNMW